MTRETQTLIANQLSKLQDKVGEFISFFQQDLSFDTMIYTHWSARNVLGHITFWHESFACNLLDLIQNRPPNPLRGKLSEVNKMSVETTRHVSVDMLIERLKAAQKIIDIHIFNTDISIIPYKKGSRSYTRLEHLEIVEAHIKRHLKDLNKAF
ncbi:hypothetical protein FNH22_31000 [Fulvivirga sp. M361]|uniref:hypothetical protein n=1 Tax=Fulvivirga sp. M361 TaxID=2594266 RepID=UPI00117A7F5D|nr:hypothetical protein [Fulvivirga sp. M361]TRX46395.1 hypothetical protein FNH22_31000 [Fulvivirga sp. M361]